MEKCCPNRFRHGICQARSLPRVATAVRPGARRDWGLDHEFRCRDVNGRFAELTGLARAEHPGKTLFDIVPAQTPQLLPLFQQLRQGAPMRI